MIPPFLHLLSKRIDRYLVVPLIFTSVVYLLSLSHHSFPGTSALLIAEAARLTTDVQQTHPLFSAVTHLLASLPFSSLPLRLNLLAAVCACVSATLFYRLLAQMILNHAYDPYEQNEEDMWPEDKDAPKPSFETVYTTMGTYNQRVLSRSIKASLAATLLLCVTAPFWLAATHLNTQIFDLTLVLLILTLFPKLETPLCHYRFLFASILFTMGLFESVSFTLLLSVIVWISFRFYMAMENRALVLVHTLLGGMAGIMLSFWLRPLVIDSLQPTFLLNFERFLKLIVHHHIEEVNLLFFSKGWLLLLFQTALPAAVLLFGKPYLLDKWGGHTKLTALLLLTVALPSALNLPFSPFRLLQETGHLPVFSSVILAATLGLVLAASLIFFVPKGFERKPEDLLLTGEEPPPKPSEAPAYSFIIILIVLALITPLRSYPYVSSKKSQFADRFAREMVQTMGDRTWLVTNGHLDHHLRIQAYLLGKHVRLIPLRQQEKPAELKALNHAIETDPAFKPLNHPRLQNALSIGTIRFVMEWMSTDTNICQKVMVFSNPELWTLCKYRPVSEGLAFGGRAPTNTIDVQPLISTSKAYEARLASALLAPEATACHAVLKLSAFLRLKMGFAANELGVLLEERGSPDEAFAAYQRANRIDPENVSALLNTYAMAKGGKVKTGQLEILKQRLRELLKDRAKSLLGLQGLFLNYGTIHQKSFYQQEAEAWLTRGVQTIAQMKARRAISLTQRTDIQTLSERAHVYFMSGDTPQAEACFLAALEQDPSDFDALYGMTLLMIALKELNRAESYLALATAAKKKDKEAIVLYPTILLAIRHGQKERAEQLLAQATTTYPEMEAFWKLRATFHLQQGDYLLVRHKVLPEMTKALKDPEHYLIHIVRGLMLKQQGKAYYRDARISLLKGLSLNASMSEIWNDVLDLDMLIGSLDVIESDIRHLLTLDPDHAQANYMKGSIQLARKKLSSAEDFFRRSIERMPTAIACNDLAETLRRQKKLKEAREFAHQAVTLDPKMPQARATLADILAELENEENICGGYSCWMRKNPCVSPGRTGTQMVIRAEDGMINSSGACNVSIWPGKAQDTGVHGVASSSAYFQRMR
jgi:tetratricopeptide (TPR) repeat protein